MSVIGIIPARAGSKRLKDKNMLTINNEPLVIIAYKTLRAAGLDRVIVATDIKEVEKVIKPQNVYWRPKALNGGDVPVQDVIRWAYEQVDEVFDYIVMLLPNCPGVDSFDIRTSVDTLITNGLNLVRSYGIDGVENGLLVAKTEYYMNHEVDTYCGGVVTGGYEIHDIDDYVKIKDIIEIR